jgi:transposase
MIRVLLTPEQRAAVQALRRDPTLRPVERERVEMVLLSAEGWSPPRIARHLGCHPATVRQVLKRFAADGPAGLRRGRPGPPKDEARRRRVTAALDRLLAEDRTWTAAQLAAALGEQGIRLSARQTRKYLKLLGARWRRTVSTLAHKQDPERAARAARVLAGLKKSPRPGSSAWPTSTSAASAPASR